MYAAVAGAEAAKEEVERLKAVNARLESVSSAYREAAEGERQERERAEEALEASQREVEAVMETLVRTEQQLAEAHDVAEAWREAARARVGDFEVLREEKARKANAKAKVAGRRAERLGRDVGELQASILMLEVREMVASRELSELDGQASPPPCACPTPPVISVP